MAFSDERRQDVAGRAVSVYIAGAQWRKSGAFAGKFAVSQTRLTSRPRVGSCPDWRGLLDSWLPRGLGVLLSGRGAG